MVGILSWNPAHREAVASARRLASAQIIDELNSQTYDPRGSTTPVLQVVILARILIVDDEATDRLLIQTFLEKGGHEVFFALDGPRAMETFSREDIDLVITDLQMPNVHGLEFITQLMSLSRPPPIIAISGSGPEQLEMARAVGADATLSKPFDPDAFLSTVTRVLTGDP